MTARKIHRVIPRLCTRGPGVAHTLSPAFPQAAFGWATGAQYVVPNHGSRWCRSKVVGAGWCTRNTQVEFVAGGRPTAAGGVDDDRDRGVARVSLAELSTSAFGTGGDGPPPSDERVPPQDVHAEQSVLGGMLLSKDAIADCVEGLRGTDFYRPAHELIYDAILDLYGRGEPADAITVSDELSKRGDLQRVGGQAYLHTLIQAVPTAANAGYYARIVSEQAAPWPGGRVGARC